MVSLIPIAWAMGCASNDTLPDDDTGITSTVLPDVADVVSVEVDSDGDLHTFSVGLLSPDVDCDQYADWWELLSVDGSLVYRRILNHSHVDEQPFVRSSTPIKLASNTPLIVRGHMHPVGYGGRMFTGTISAGFTQYTGKSDFADGLEKQEPLPDDCLF